jgi:hypothetical protein
VEITGLTKDQSWREVDLSSYNFNPRAVGVLIEFVNTNAVIGTKRQAGARATNRTDEFHQSLAGDDVTANTIVPIDVDSKIDYYLHADVDIFIRGELQDGCVFYSSPVFHSPADAGDVGAWVEKQITLQGSDTYDDVEAVILEAIYSESNVAGWNARQKGSTITNVPGCNEGTGLMSRICGVDSNGKFELYSTGKTTPSIAWYVGINEVGYVKKGHYTAILNPSKSNLPPVDPFTNHDFTNVSDVVSIFGRWAYDAGIQQNSHLRIRQKGSTDPSARINLALVGSGPTWAGQQGMACARVDQSGECEYRLWSVGSNDFWIEGYSIGGVHGDNALVLDSGELVIDSSNATIG